MEIEGYRGALASAFIAYNAQYCGGCWPCCTQQSVLWGLLALWWLLWWWGLWVLGWWSLLVGLLVLLLLILLWWLRHLSSVLGIHPDNICVGKSIPEALFVIPGDDEYHIDDEDDSADIRYPSQDIPHKGLAHINGSILLVHDLELHHFFTYCGTTGASLHDHEIHQH